MWLCISADLNSLTGPVRTDAGRDKGLAKHGEVIAGNRSHHIRTMLVTD